MLLNTCYNVAAKQTVRFSSPSGPWGWAEPASTAPVQTPHSSPPTPTHSPQAVLETPYVPVSCPCPKRSKHSGLLLPPTPALSVVLVPGVGAGVRRGCHCGTNVAGQLGTVGARATAKALVASLGQAPQSEVSCLGPILTAARVHRSQGPPQPCCLPTMPQPRFSQEDPTDPHPSVVVAGTRQPTGGLRPSATQAVLRKQCHMQDGPPGVLFSQGPGLADSPQHRGPRPHVKVAHPSYLGPTCSPRWLCRVAVALGA